jgi:hypothetical protein
MLGQLMLHQLMSYDASIRGDAGWVWLGSGELLKAIVLIQIT